MSALAQEETMAPRRMIKLLAGMETGPTMNHSANWRHPDTDNAFLTPEGWEHIARVLEYGKFDGVFLADTMALPDNFPGVYQSLLQHGGQMDLFDPIVIAAMMARVTTRLGIGVTLSTTLLNSYHIARMLATLDVMSKGRAAWNVVTSSNPAAARNFGMTALPPKEERYDRADEVLEACFGLWDSWEADAIRLDKERGVFIDSGKVHRAEYKGRWVSTYGPLNVPRSPQARPVIMQAGASDRGREFASRWAEVIFTIQYDQQSMHEFYNDVKTRMLKYRRDPDDMGIFVSVDVITGETQSIAQERADYVNNLVGFDVAAAVVAKHTGLDVTQFPLDQPLESLPQSSGSYGTLLNLVGGAKALKLTLREAVIRYGISGMTPQLVGTAKSVADQMEEIFRAGCCDGFIISQAASPGGYEQFVRAVVPELQRRGLFRTEYENDTFRATLREVG
jgi:FMN-dependent oxidoreductase (nitrilotriacetate monooxygenase family)